MQPRFSSRGGLELVFGDGDDRLGGAVPHDAVAHLDLECDLRPSVPGAIGRDWDGGLGVISGLARGLPNAGRVAGAGLISTVTTIWGV